MIAWPRSLTQRTLGLIAGSVGAIVVAATAVSYRAVFRAVEAKQQQSLAQYTFDRARREEVPFLQAEANHRALKAAFLERWNAAPEAGYRERFAAHFARTPDGAMRSRRELVDPLRQPSTWIHPTTPITDELQRLVLVCHDLSAQFFPAWREFTANIFMTSPMQFNAGIDPRLPEWVWQIEADFDQNAHEWHQSATVQNNPARKSVWTGVFLDPADPNPAMRQPMVTLCTPIDVEGRHLLTLHQDAGLDGLLASAVRPERERITHVIFREDGRLIAHPDQHGALVASQGELNLRSSPELDLAWLYAAATAQAASPSSGYNVGTDQYFAVARLHGPEWYFVSLLPQAELRREAAQAAQWVLWSGIGALAFVLATLALILRRQVERPIRELVTMTRRLTAGEPVVDLPVERADEIGDLAAAFNEMTRRVTERDSQLRSLNQDLEQRVEQRTLELRESEARLRTLLDHSPIAIVTLDADSGRFLDANEHALRLLGVSRDDLTGLGPAELSPPEQPDGQSSVEAAQGRIAEAVAGGSPIFDWLHREPSGREVACEVHLARLPASGRRLLVGTLLDVTMRKRTEAELLRTLARERELGQLKSDFVSMVSHEFRTPLEVIITSGEILDRYFERLDPEQRRQQLAAIHRSVRRMSEMMESVLLLSRVEAGTVSCQPAPLEIVHWTGRLVDELGSATNHVCPIELDIRSDLAGAWGDAILLRHMLGNLLSNAVKYSAPGTPVRLVIERDGPEAVIHVIDHGCGIPQNERPALFRAFHRCRNVQHLSGTGLGLVIVKRCVDLHHGRIQCESTEGQGTTFTVRLPLFAPSVAAAPANPMATPLPH